MWSYHRVIISKAAANIVLRELLRYKYSGKERVADIDGL